TTAANGTQLGHAVANLYLKAGVMDSTPARPITNAQAGMYRSTRDHSVLNLAAGADAGRNLFEPGNRLRVVTEQDEIVYEKVDRWTPAPAELAAFAGSYTSDEAEVTLTVAVENDRLVA